jgi:hypothetical protein
LLKEKYSKIKRGFGTKILGGGPIFPMPYYKDNEIVETDRSFNFYKED